MADLTVGDTAPNFDLPRDGGESVSFEALKGQNVVLYFYPRDDTSGCTKEAIAFTDQVADFAELNTVIYGISKDTVTKHEKFVAKHQLGVGLISDADGSMCEDYGVWVEKSMYGKKYMGIERATFLVDAEGKIAQIWRKVKVPGHADAVLQAVKTL